MINIEKFKIYVTYKTSADADKKSAEIIMEVHQEVHEKYGILCADMLGELTYELYSKGKYDSKSMGRTVNQINEGVPFEDILNPLCELQTN